MCRLCLLAGKSASLFRLDPPPARLVIRSAQPSRRLRTFSTVPSPVAAPMPIPRNVRTLSSASVASSVSAPQKPTATRVDQVSVRNAARFSTPSSFPPEQQTPTKSGAEPDTSPASPPPLKKPAHLTEGESAVWNRLVSAPALDPVWQLRVQDVSGGCGSMYGIEIASAAFRGLSVLKQQRLVNTVLGDMVKEWHGLQLRTTVP